MIRELIFRSDDTECNKGKYLAAYEEFPENEEIFYHKMLNDSDVSKLETWQQKIILEQLRRRMCLGKAKIVNNPYMIDEECNGYTGR